METILGELVLKKNNSVINYSIIELVKESKQFRVDSRYKIICDTVLQKGDVIECLINVHGEKFLESCVETGENLALISLYLKNIKLSIGTQGDMDDREYQYLRNGMRIKLLTDITKINFYISWLEMEDVEKEDIYTWFASDPLFDS